MQLWQKVTLGLVLGFIAGMILPSYVVYFKPVGDIFLRLIKMIIGPLIFCSLVNGILGMSDTRMLGRTGIKAVVIFFIMSVFAVILGLFFGLYFKPGEGIKIDFNNNGVNNNIKFDIVNFIINIVPDNFIKAFVDGNLLQIVFASIFTGITIQKMSSQRASFKNSFHLITQLMFKMIEIIINLSPYAAFALTGWVVSTQGMGVLISLSKLVLVASLAMFIQYITYGILIKLSCGLSPIPFYKKSLKYQILAFSTSSSKATLPTTMQTCREDLGISESSTSFILPLGASINMNGLAINLSLATVFFSQVLGITLHLQDYIVIIFTATLGSIGGAGIPGAVLIMLPMVLSSVHLPIDGIAILAGIDRIIDMIRTVINITGDAAVTLIIDHKEGLLDEKKYLQLD